MPRKSPSRKLSRLADELRKAAKASLDNPGSLTHEAVPLLHSLPGVQERASKTGDSVRAIRRWLVEDFLREFEIDPRDLAPADRQEALRRRLIVKYLFQLDPALAGLGITRRRVLLAGRLWSRRPSNSDDYDRAIDPATDEEDPRRLNNIRQTEEPPVFERLAHLASRQMSLADPRPPERRDAQRLLKGLSRTCLLLLADLWSWLDAVDASGRAFASLRRELPVHARGRYDHLTPEVSGTDYLLRALWTYMQIDTWWRTHWPRCLRLMYSFRDEVRGPLFGILTELNSWHGDDREVYAPWPRRQQSALRAAHAQADGEYGAFLDWLDFHPSGKLVKATWLRWVERSNRSSLASFELMLGFVAYVRSVSWIEEALGQDRAGLGPAIRDLVVESPEVAELSTRVAEARAQHRAYLTSLWQEDTNGSNL